MLILNVSSHYDQLKLFTGIISLKVWNLHMGKCLLIIE